LHNLRQLHPGPHDRPGARGRGATGLRPERKRGLSWCSASCPAVIAALEDPLTVKPAALERQFRNLAEIFWHRVEDTAELEAFRYPVGESWKSLSWKQTGERVEAIACGLLSLGIEKEQRCGILCSTR